VFTGHVNPVYLYLCARSSILLATTKVWNERNSQKPRVLAQTRHPCPSRPGADHSKSSRALFAGSWLLIQSGTYLE